MKAKHIPNALGVLRIACCVALIPLMIMSPFTLLMMVIYMVAGFTDMIDGTLARRIKDAKSDFGATLDSVADMVLVIVSVVLLIPAMVSNVFGDAVSLSVWEWMYWAWLGVLGFKLFSGTLGRIKHKKMVFLHTYTNKLLGLVLFLIPIFYYFAFVVAGAGATTMLVFNIYLVFSLALVAVITTEEIVINVKLLEPSPNIRSIFDVRISNEETLRRRQLKSEQNVDR
jgi:CDP-diacylglycerol--glycerol-3-phosphate 3-phosphatidyltransferase